MSFTAIIEIESKCRDVQIWSPKVQKISCGAQQFFVGAVQLLVSAIINN